MNVNDVIEAYVADVAVHLPRRQRNDVALELRALLNEEMQARADGAGRAADADMAVEFLRAFGRPVDVAARYGPTLNIIDPADGQRFMRAVVVGLAIIWCAGLLQYLQQPISSGTQLLAALAQWWMAVVIPSIWWPGLLVIGFGSAAWARRRWPRPVNWKPLAPDRIQGGRSAIVLGLVGILCGVFALFEPRWLLDIFWGGRAAPAAYQALTYSDTFLRLQAPLLLLLILLNIPLLVAVLIKGRWSTTLRRAESALGLITCAAMLWTVLDGPVLVTSVADQTAKLCLVLIVAMVLVHAGMKLLRNVSPSPNQRSGA